MANENIVVLAALRDTYGKDEAAQESMTVGELAELLECYAEEYGAGAKIILSHDRGYTYGIVRETRFKCSYEPEEWGF